MKKKIKRIVQFIVDPIALNLGYKKIISSKSKKNELLDNFYTTIIKMGFKPSHIVDVGANHGTWTREALKYFPNAKYTLLEPQEWLKSSFEDILKTNKNISFHGVGAGSKKGVFKFTIVERDDSCSFRISKDEARNKGYEQIDIPIVTLNDLLNINNIPDIIKIDAEGLDLDVLEGASNFFGKTEIFMVEAGVVNKIFENSFLKLANYMDKKGYRLFDLTDLNRPLENKVLWLVELVFIKKNGFIDSQELLP